MSDDGDLTAMRYDNWKFIFREQRMRGTMRVWMEPFVELRMPKVFNVRTDPYERAGERRSCRPASPVRCASVS